MPEVTYKVPVAVGTPSAPNHAVPLSLMEEKLEGLRWDPVKAAAVGNLAATASPDGLTLTADANGALPSIDGIACAEDDHILLPNQSDKSQNGLYYVAELGDSSNPWILKRARYADASNEFRPNKLVYVQPGGIKNGDSTFKQVTGTTIVIGTTPIEFALNIDTNKVLSVEVPFQGDGSKKEWDLTHTLNTTKVNVNVYDAQRNWVGFARQVVNASTVKVSATELIPAGEQYYAVIMGQPE